MQTVDFFLLPINDANEIDTRRMDQIDKVTQMVKDNGDLFWVPVEFYSTKDKQGIAVYEYLYTMDSTEIQLLREILSHSKSLDTTYQELVNNADRKRAFITTTKDEISDELVGRCVEKVSDMPLVYVELVDESFTYDNLYEWRNRCFPKIFFTKDTFFRSDQIGPFRDNMNDILNSLKALNNISKDDKTQYSEPDLLGILQARAGVACTGKGSNEPDTFKKKIEVTDKEKNIYLYDISCIPHFKLDTRHSDKRIYFSWGREELKNNTIIVVHVGPHWSKENKEKSSIEGYIHEVC